MHDSMMILVGLITLALLPGAVYSLIHDLKIANDDRNIFKIETFGFVAGGEMSMELTGFSMEAVGEAARNMSAAKIGFIMRKAPSESAAQQDLEKVIETSLCLMDDTHKDDYVLDISKPTAWESSTGKHTVPADGAGLYSLIFVRCNPSGPYKVNFELYAKFYNPGPNYLSAGDTPLPRVYMIFCGLFTIALILWCLILFKSHRAGTTVHQIHYMMAALLLLKCLTLLFESIRFHYISVNGSSEGWSIVYYVFAFSKGIMLFTVILLIGSGWSLMKPFLNDKEKRIIMVVLTLQVVDNIAVVVLEETAPGSQYWLTWRDLLHLIDIVCCCAIMVPIVWSIRHLRQAVELDGKAQMNLQKLQLFRQFYVMVVAYVYFTRIVVLLLAATIPFYLLWLDSMFTELATLTFFVVTGIQFRPSDDNPYMLKDDEEVLLTHDCGLDIDDIDEDPGFEDSRGAGAVQLTGTGPGSRKDASGKV